MNLSIQLAPKHPQGLLLTNPVMTASSTFGYGTEYSHTFDIQKLGANRGKQAVLVTHDVIAKVLVAHILGASNSIYRRFDISNASLSVIRVISNSSQLAMLNDTSHLEG